PVRRSLRIGSGSTCCDRTAFPRSHSTGSHSLPLHAPLLTSVSHVFDGIGGTAPSVDALGPQSFQMRPYPGLEVGGPLRTCRTPCDIREGKQPRVEHELHIAFTAN